MQRRRDIEVAARGYDKIHLIINLHNYKYKLKIKSNKIWTIVNSIKNEYLPYTRKKNI